ncbi:MAG: hypothetical protein FWC26_12915, partial [Fibromonadales bacterium]|nr:hypothetical protein [Fibromonadales bacterium]
MKIESYYKKLMIFEKRRKPPLEGLFLSNVFNPKRSPPVSKSSQIFFKVQKELDVLSRSCKQELSVKTTPNSALSTEHR